MIHICIDNNDMHIDIKRSRNKLGLSQRDFAKAINVSQATICRYERNTSRLPFDVAMRIKELLSEKLGIDIPIESLIEKKK